MAADLKTMGILSGSNCTILDEYARWRMGESTKEIDEKMEMFKIVHSIELRFEGSFSTIYFSLPFLNRFSKKSL